MNAPRSTAITLATIAALLAVPAAWLAITWRAPARYTLSAIPGATLDHASPGGDPGLVVTSLRSDGAAGAAGLRVGDRIDRIDGQPASTTQAVRRDIEHAMGRSMDIRVWRAGHIREIRIARTVGG